MTKLLSLLAFLIFILACTTQAQAAITVANTYNSVTNTTCVVNGTPQKGDQWVMWFIATATGPTPSDSNGHAMTKVIDFNNSTAWMTVYVMPVIRTPSATLTYTSVAVNRGCLILHGADAASIQVATTTASGTTTFTTSPAFGSVAAGGITILGTQNTGGIDPTAMTVNSNAVTNYGNGNRLGYYLNGTALTSVTGTATYAVNRTGVVAILSFNPGNIVQRASTVSTSACTFAYPPSAGNVVFVNRAYVSATDTTSVTDSASNALTNIYDTNQSGAVWTSAWWYTVSGTPSETYFYTNVGVGSADCFELTGVASSGITSSSGTQVILSNFTSSNISMTTGGSAFCGAANSNSTAPTSFTLQSQTITPYLNVYGYADVNTTASDGCAVSYGVNRTGVIGVAAFVPTGTPSASQFVDPGAVIYERRIRGIFRELQAA